MRKLVGEEASGDVNSVKKYLTLTLFDTKNFGFSTKVLA